MKKLIPKHGDVFYSVGELCDLFNVSADWILRTCDNHNIPLYCTETDVTISKEDASILHYWYCYYLANSPLPPAELY